MDHGVRTHANSKSNPFYQRLRRESNPRHCITQDSEPSTLLTELFRSMGKSDLDSAIHSLSYDCLADLHFSSTRCFGWADPSYLCVPVCMCMGVCTSVLCIKCVCECVLCIFCLVFLLVFVNASVYVCVCECAYVQYVSMCMMQLCICCV